MYKRPAFVHRTELVVQNSQFITTVGPCVSVRDARIFLQKVRDEMPTASHHVYVFRVGYANSVIEGMSDDGEPSGTAAPPILSVLRGTDIGDIALVTTRYFGGTKLGKGGLVKAYSDSAKIALQNLKLQQVIASISYKTCIHYAHYNLFKIIVAGFEPQEIVESFEDIIYITVKIPDYYAKEFLEHVKNSFNGEVILEEIS